MTSKTMMSIPVSFLYMTRQGANTVELAGSFNNWTKVAMGRGPWEWDITLELPPGKYEYKFIVDNKWTHNQGKSTTTDGMGGLNNVYTVEKNQGGNSTVEFTSTGDAKIHRENRMGKYVKTNQHAQGRPVFQQANKEDGKKQYFLFVGPGDCWRVGPDITTYSGSVLKHPKKNQNLPPRTGWNYYLNDKWHNDETLEAVVKLRGTLDEKKLAFSKSQLKKKIPDLKPALMVALEADFEKLKEKGKLDWLVKEQHMDLDDCKELLSRIEDDVNEEMGMFGPIPLMVAATFGWEEVCKVLLSAGANVDTNETSWGSRDSPLMAAATSGWPDICELLLSAGADINLKNEEGYGKNALDIAIENKNTEVVAVLEKHGASASELNLNQILEFHKISLAEIDKELEHSGSTPLLYAVRRGYKDAIRVLLDAGADVDIEKEREGKGDRIYIANDSTALLYVAECGESDVCQMLISAGADVNKENEYKMTPLHYAAENGNVDICKMLIEAGADINKQDRHGATPLMNALRKKQGAKIAMMLLSAGAAVNKKKINGETALSLASGYGYTEIVKIIIEKEPNMAAAPSEQIKGLTALMEAANNGHTEVCKLLLQGGAAAEIDNQNFRGDTALIMAAKGDSPDICELLLSAGADMNKRNYHYYGRTALDIANYENYSQVVAVLEKHGATVSRLQLDRILKKHKISVDNLDKEDEDGDIPLMYAAKIRNGDACKMLLKAGADVNKATEWGKTAIWIAAENGWSDICQILIEAGADVNKEYDSRTPILTTIYNDYANESCHADTVKILIDAGAKLNEYPPDGFAPLNQAILRNHSVIKMLIDGGADVDLLNHDETPLMMAADYFHEDICKLLLEGGAQIDKANDDGWTALAFAAKNRHDSICTMLINAGASIEKVEKAYKGKLYKEPLLTYLANLDK